MNTFSNPIKIIEQLSFFHSAHIADFGCGAGAYSLALAKKTPLGKIFAIDIRKDMIERLGNLAESEGLKNIHVVWGDIDDMHGSRLRDASMDMIVITNTLFQVEKPNEMLLEARRVLKNDGQLVLIDWKESFGNIGPKPDSVVTEESAKSLLLETGFTISKSLNAGEHHYGFTATKL